MSLFWGHVKYFTPIEMACSHCGQEGLVKKDLMLRLDQMREKYGKPITISSGYRCKHHPIEKRKVEAGRKPGVHTTGFAADIACSHAEAWEILKLAFEVGFTRIGVNQKGDGRFIHVDCYEGPDFPRPALWTY
jgi:uncharacterized protein YcbK (DUF882 family)